jgi:hypothetical protein
MIALGMAQASLQGLTARPLTTLTYSLRETTRQLGGVAFTSEAPRFRSRPEWAGQALDALVREHTAAPTNIRHLEGDLSRSCLVLHATLGLVTLRCIEIGNPLDPSDPDDNGDGGDGSTPFERSVWLEPGLPAARAGELMGPRGLAALADRACTVRTISADESVMVSAEGIGLGTSDPADLRLDCYATDLADAEIPDPTPRLRALRRGRVIEETP